MTETSQQAPAKPLLDGIRIIDLGNNIAGPCVATILGGMGAEVIKVERPESGDVSRLGPPFAGKSGVSGRKSDDANEDQVSVGFMKRNRGKSSVTLDLRNEHDRQRFIALVASADVMVENGLPGALKKLGVGYETLKARNPDLILCSVTGFGQTGPCATWAAYDAIVQAHSGTMVDVTSSDAASGVMMADMAGCMYAAISVLGALVSRLRGGSGAWLDVSMLEATIAFGWESNRDIVQRQRDRGETVRRVAPWNVYPAADGRVMICAYTDRQFQTLKQHIGMTDDRFEDRLERIRLVVELDAAIGAWTSQQPKWDIAHTLQKLGIPASPVLNALEVINSPQVVERGVFKPVLHPRLGDIDVVVSEFPLRVNGQHMIYERATPALGEHNDKLDLFIANRPGRNGPTGALS